MIPSDPKPVMLITVAVLTEFRPFQEFFQNARENEIGRRRLIEGDIRGIPLYALITGPGAVNAAQAVTAAVERLHPVLIINSGCAGFYPASGMNIGDIGVATEEIQAELGLERPNSLLPDELPFDIVSLGKTGCKHRYPIESETVSKVYHQLRADSQCFVTTGPFVTVSTITATDNRMRAMEIRFAPIMESMEGAAVAQVCLHYGISFVEIRAASNRVGDRNRDSWNIPLACRRFAEAVVNCLTTFREMAEPLTRGNRFY